MLQEAKDLQNRAVSQMVNILLVNKSQKELTVKAPTGSGKTYMMADFMNRILATQQNVIFLVSSLSKSELAEQNYQSFCELSNNGIFSNLKPYLINSETSGEGSSYIPTGDYNVYVLPRDLYKDKSRLKEEGTFRNFLSATRYGDVINNTTSKLIYVIKDECHIATSNLDELNSFFSVVVNFSATPNLRRNQQPDVQISNLEAVKSKLIKEVEFQPATDTLDQALDKFDTIKKDYVNKLQVNPCFIIQISNKNKAETELKNTISPALDKHQDLKWVYITGDQSGKGCDTNDSGLKKLPVSKWKTYMKGKESNISVIIFKMVISEGWDIPRACMLYQVRDTQSKQLDEQVMGRVRRNPRLLDFENLSKDAQDLASTAWIWGVKPKEEVLPKYVSLFSSYDIENEIKVKTTKLNVDVVHKKINVADLLGEKSPNLTGGNIFEMQRKLSRQENEVQSLCYNYAKSYADWRLFVENIEEIKKAFHSYIANYEDSMSVLGEFSFPYGSCYNETDKTLTLEDWVWFRKDAGSVVVNFSFDSDAEKAWAEVLKDIRKDYIQQTNIASQQKQKFLWGKNFPLNSEIKFEYFSDGVHSSYPDFVMKDTKGRIHIFEVKSVNKSASFNINEEEYNEKVRNLKACYKACSEKTQHIFYLPILDGSDWKITVFKEGNEENITKDKFIESLNK